MESISVIVPAHNEEAVLPRFYQRTSAVLAQLGLPYEMVFVDDGSSDGSGALIRSLHDRDPRVKLLQLSRNFGKEAAMSAGLDVCSGELTVIIDADLQDPPELIPAMLEKYREGFDVIYATRTSRAGETWLKRATAGAFYRLIGRWSRVEIPANTGDFRLLSRRAVLALRSMKEGRRFMKGLFNWIGYRQASLLYQREARAAGSTKWSYWRLWNFALEGITSFSLAPLQLASWLGFCTATGAFVYACFLIARTVLFGVDVPGYASLLVVMLFLGGGQLLFLGILGEYIGRIFDETKQRPLYFVQERLGDQELLAPAASAATYPRAVEE